MSAVFQRPPTAQEAVLAELRRFIATGRLRPGQQIIQDALAVQLGVSRVPLREALKILEGEGQVTYAGPPRLLRHRAVPLGPAGGLPDPRDPRG